MSSGGRGVEGAAPCGWVRDAGIGIAGNTRASVEISARTLGSPYRGLSRRFIFPRQGGGGGYGGQGRDGDEAEAADEGVQYLGGDVF